MAGRRAPNNMGSIKERADGRWEGKFTLPNGKRKSIYAATSKEVTDKAKKILNDMRMGLPVRSDESLTVKEYLTSWLETKKVRPTTLRQYRVSLNVHIIPALGRHRLTKLTPQHVRLWMADEEKAGKCSRTTIRLALATLKTALSEAVSDELVSRNVAKLVKAPPVSSFEAKFLTVAQARQFLTTIKGHRLEAFYGLVLSLGLRRGEALALAWDDIDFERATLHVQHTIQRIDGMLRRTQPKTKGSNRTIQLPPDLLTMLRDHRTNQLNESMQTGADWAGNEWNLVFVSERGTPLEPRNLNRQLTALLKQAGLEHMRVHDCRHTACALLLSQGIPVHVVSQILGHANPAITLKVYAKVLPSQQHAAASLMNELLFQ